MAFAPNFLDEIRSRVPLTEIVGRKVKLARRGQEHWGLCPFHNEKTPSFHVNEAKGFFHCFGCGAHGDAFGFEMQANGLSFPEAVERLASLAGLPMPARDPHERQRAERQATLYDVLEAATRWFEARLRAPAGRAGLDYLRGRGLDDGAIARFRLGFAPEGHQVLRGALGTGDGVASREAGRFTDALLIEAGLLVQPEAGGRPYDRFRGRVMFPILDTRGRVVAFGARALADIKPKYLNSPDGPLFHKGRVLYGLAPARDAIRARGEAVVAEGYMDVIALHRAGFGHAVAPLGTAVTEDQLALLWRVARRVVLCLDGDEAGLRAAARAIERILPLLGPERSAALAILPEGADPDSLIRDRGAAGMAAALERALPIEEALWRLESGRTPLKTPEDYAGLEKRLEQACGLIQDQGVRYRYRAFCRDRVNAAFRQTRLARQGLAGGPAGSPAGGRAGAFPGMRAIRAAPPRPADPRPLLERIILAGLLNHPGLLAEGDEAVGLLRFGAPELDNLRQRILEVAAMPGLDTGALESHLLQAGLSDVMERVKASEVYAHAGFVRPGVDEATVRRGWRQALARYRRPLIDAEVEATRRAMAAMPASEAELRSLHLRMQQLRKQQEEFGALAAENDE